MKGPDSILLDVDGTLVDSTYHHAMAWHRAFAMFEVRQPLWRIHRRIGMGGDHLVSAVAGEEVEARLGDDLRQAWGTEYDRLIEEVIPLPGAADLIRSLKDRGFRVALASSGPREHTERSADLLGVRDLLDAITSSADADSSKPAPDILNVALRTCGGTSAIVVGDSVYDVESASRLPAPCVAVRTGGFGAAELKEAGAVLVVDGPSNLLETDWRSLTRPAQPG